MLAILILGYILFFMLCCLGSCVCCLLCVAARGGNSDNARTTSLANNIPYLNAIKSLKKEKYHDIEDKDTETCVICMCAFGDED